MYLLFSFFISSFAFLAQFFGGHLLGFISAEKVSGKAFRIVGLDGRKCRRVVVEQDFHWNFLIIFASLFAFFSVFPDKNVLILAWLVWF